MTIGEIARVEGYKAQVAINGKTVTVSDTNQTFVALVREETLFDPDMPLGSDPREVVIFETLRPAPVVEAQAQVKFDGITLQLTKRDDNPANPFVRFTAIKVI